MRTSNALVMRFAYIDSNGNEVPIPSVDALALRIELGAITEQTQLYDAQADQWGPAHTHEIFHSLSRSASAEEGFVAPPPVAPPQAAPAAPPPPEPSVEDQAPAAETPEDGVTDGAEDVLEPMDSSFGLTLAEPEASEDQREEGPDGGGADLGLTLADTPEPTDGESSSADAGHAVVEPSEPAGTFDFGDMDGGLELEGPEPDDETAEPVMDLTGAAGGFAPGGAGAPGDDEPLDFSGGMELETSMEFGAEGFEGGGEAPLDLETPMSEFTPAAPPAWMDSDDDGESAEDVMDFSSVGKSGGDGAEDEVPLRERRSPRNRPSAPKLRRQRNLAGPLIAVVALLAVGLGGYVAWPVVSATLAARGEPDDPAVVIPEIPEELEPRMRGLAAGSFAAIYADARRAWAATGPVQAPPREWLSGVYLANAGDFQAVEDFWHGMSDFLEHVRAADLARFDAAFAAGATAEGIRAADAAMLRERADSGFVAAAPERAETYAQVEALIDAALRLHQFLVANEDAIEYAPASSVTTDPVLEATATPEIQAAMHDMIDAVTRGLGAIGYRDRVSADGLWSTILATVQQNGIR